MRRLLLFLLFIFGAVLHAETPWPFIPYVGTGLSTPRAPSEFQRNYRAGYNLGVGIGTMLSSKLELKGYFTYHDFTLDTQGFISQYDYDEASTVVEGGKSSVMAALVNIKMLFPTQKTTKVIPYFFVGGGLFRVQNKDVEVMTEETAGLIIPGKKETAPGSCIGVGFDFKMDEYTTLFLEVKVDVGFTKDETTVVLPITFGVSVK
ncbi:outer membrane beta-barrel protein [candidate division KSB1 bacterium]|nr:outer membrane beta-barrel protein [candidate division KSB1 bacterium]